MNESAQYTVYLRLLSGWKVFLNPAESTYGGVDPEVGSEVNGALVCLTSDLATAEALVAKFNAVLHHPDEARLTASMLDPSEPAL